MSEQQNSTIPTNGAGKTVTENPDTKKNSQDERISEGQSAEPVVQGKLTEANSTLDTTPPAADTTAREILDGGLETSSKDKPKGVKAKKATVPAKAISKTTDFNKSIEKIKALKKSINECDDEIESFRSRLIKADEHDEDFSTPLPGYERRIFEANIQRKKNEKRKFTRQLHKLEGHVSFTAKKQKKALRQEDLEDKTSDPSYYKRYGNLIPDAIDRAFAMKMSPDQVEALTKLKGLQASAQNDTGKRKFNAAMHRFLRIYYPSLHIRIKGDMSSKDRHYERFIHGLKSWDAAKAKFKKR